MLPHNLWLTLMGMKQKKIQNGQLKKTEFFKSTNSQKFFAKISGIDAKEIDVDQPIWLSCCTK